MSQEQEDNVIVTYATKPSVGSVPLNQLKPDIRASPKYEVFRE